VGGEGGRRRWERDGKGGGSVLLYLTRAGSMARAGAVVSEWRCLPGGGVAAGAYRRDCGLPC